MILESLILCLQFGYGPMSCINFVAIFSIQSILLQPYQLYPFYYFFAGMLQQWDGILLLFEWQQF
jgi:hypothetical protein